MYSCMQRGVVGSDDTVDSVKNSWPNNQTTKLISYRGVFFPAALSVVNEALSIPCSSVYLILFRILQPCYSSRESFSCH